MQGIFIVIIWWTLNTAESVSTSISESTCNKVNTTVTCNNIPVSVPAGTVSVLLRLQLTNDTFLNSSTFTSSGWDKISQIEFRVDGDYHFVLQDNCFNGLKDLRVLKLHIICLVHLDLGSFEHLDNVEVLDMSDSVRLFPVEFTRALGGYDKLVKFPKLTALFLSRSFLYRTGLILDDNVVHNLLSNKISLLDMSSLQISQMNLTSIVKRLKQLDILNGSHANLDNFEYYGIDQSDVINIKSLDVSFITFPKKIVPYLPGKIKAINLVYNLSERVEFESLRNALSPVTLNVSGIIPYPISLWAWNCKVHIDISPDFLTKTLVARKNNIRRLDVSFICDMFNLSSFEQIDISDNDLEFIHPDFLSCIPNIRRINLSNNLLFKMSRENLYLFENILSGLKNLQHINLSHNQLTDIRIAIFKYNELVEEIDLSNNHLQQVHFSLTRQKRLRVLNLQGNKIKTLDPLSLNNLKDIHRLKKSTEHHVSIYLKDNPLDCSKCEAKTFFTWLTKSPKVDISSQGLVCSGKNGHMMDVTEHVLDSIEEICRRKTIIIATSVSAGTVCVILTISYIVYFLQRERAREMLIKGECNKFVKNG
jgi:Leucine-rich repeat (LRR) protein